MVRLADHTISIIMREKMELSPAPISDCASLNKLVQVMLKWPNKFYARYNSWWIGNNFE